MKTESVRRFTLVLGVNRIVHNVFIGSPEPQIMLCTGMIRFAPISFLNHCEEGVSKILAL